MSGHRVHRGCTQAQARVVAVGTQKWTQLANGILGENVQGYMDKEEGKEIAREDQEL